MKKFYSILLAMLPLPFISAQNCNGPGEAQIDLNANNINARLLNSGDLWWDGTNGKYITNSINGNEVSAIFAGAFWMGAIGPTMNLHVAGQTYRLPTRTDFYPGPIDDSTGQEFENGCEDWDRFFVVTKTEVNDHLLDANDGNIDNEITNIYGWPAINNPFFESIHGFALPQNQSFAPFFDVDQDGIYDPSKGDYPDVKGDENIWWVFNDIADAHRVTQGAPLGFETQVLAYASYNIDNEDLNNTTFYDVKVINKSLEPRNDAFLGLWVDFDLGCYTDDFIGYDEEYSMMYVYNQDDYDGDPIQGCPNNLGSYEDKIPILGIKKIDAAIKPVSSFIVLTGNFIFPPTSSPTYALHYYNNLRGMFKDGTPITYGGNGYNPQSIDTVNYMYTGDPTDTLGWSLCAEPMVAADRRALMNTSMGDLLPGQSFTSSYAVVVTHDVDYPCPSLQSLKNAVDNACEGIFSSTKITNKSESFNLFPNPASSEITISSDKEFSSIKLYALDGRILLHLNSINSTTHTIQVDKLSAGTYLSEIIFKDGRSAFQKMIIY